MSDPERHATRRSPWEAVRLRWARSDLRNRAAIVLAGILALLATRELFRLLFLFTRRAPYPFELEWMEGAVVDHIRFAIEGRPLYVQPSIEFTPFIYTPLYYHASAALSHVVGLGLMAPRVVSIAAALGSIALIGSFVHRQSRDTIATSLACGWFAATYGLTGFWLDIARVDSLFLLLLLSAAWLARFGRSTLSATGAGLTLALAFFTKQTALPFILPIAALSFVHGGTRALATALGFTIPLAIGIPWINRSTDGWFGYYVFDVPGQHQVIWSKWSGLLQDFFWKPVAVPVLLSVLSLMPSGVTKTWRPRIALFALLLIASGSSFLALLHRDGFVNVLIPAYAVLAITAGMGFASVRSVARARSSALIEIVATLACFFAFGALRYDARVALPTKADLEANRAMIIALGQQPRPMLMPGTGYFSFVVGQDQGSAHVMALADIFKTRSAERKRALLDEIVTSIREKRWAVIVMDPSFELLPPVVAREVRTHYRLSSKTYASDHGWPTTGFRTRPEEIWVPR